MSVTHDMQPEASIPTITGILDGMNDEGKIVSNPNIGYGSRPHKYADGTLRALYQIGLSATYAKDLGKATVTGYCIRFKTLNDINIETLEAAIRYGRDAQTEKGED